MPVHPFHWGVPGLVAPITRGRLDLFSLLLGATLPDIDVVWIAFSQGIVGHGFLHTWIGALVVALLVTLHLPFREKMRKIPLLSSLLDGRRRPATMIFFSGLVGAWTHILLDATLYEDLNIYSTSPINPFYVEGVATRLYLITGLALLAFVGWLYWRKLYSDGEAPVSSPPVRPSVLPMVSALPPSSSPRIPHPSTVSVLPPTTAPLIPHLSTNLPPTPSINSRLEFDAWKKIGVLLVVGSILMTLSIETNAPSPIGRVRIGDVRIIEEAGLNGGTSVTVHGRITHAQGVVEGELQLLVHWDGNTQELDIHTTLAGFWFEGIVMPVEAGQVLNLELYVYGSPVFYSSVTVPYG